MGLDSVELVMCLEEEFSLEIPDQDAEKLTTVGDIETYLADRLQVPESGREALFERLKAIVVDELSVHPDQVHRRARLVEDLHMD